MNRRTWLRQLLQVSQLSGVWPWWRPEGPCGSEQREMQEVLQRRGLREPVMLLRPVRLLRRVTLPERVTLLRAAMLQGV